MTDEEINRKFDIVAEHLATLAVGQQQLQEALLRSEQKWARTEEGIRSLLAIAEMHDQEIKATDERLNVLINTVERYVGGGYVIDESALEGVQVYGKPGRPKTTSPPGEKRLRRAANAGNGTSTGKKRGKK